MNTLRKKRILATLKYTWPVYLIVVALVIMLMNFLFGITHRVPNYKTLTLFISGEVTDTKTLKTDMLERFKDQDLKTFTTISAKPTDAGYNTKLTITGYNGADILIIPVTKLEKLVVSAFALDMADKLVTDYYQGYTLFAQDEVNYGVKIDKEKVSKYMTLPDEDCYMVLNGKSANIGEYSNSQIKEHDNALNLVKDWGM